MFRRIACALVALSFDKRRRHLRRQRRLIDGLAPATVGGARGPSSRWSGGERRDSGIRRANRTVSLRPAGVATAAPCTRALAALPQWFGGFIQTTRALAGGADASPVMKEDVPSASRSCSGR